MRAILSERNMVVILFVMVLITFSLAHEDSKKMQPIYTGINSSAISSFASTTQTEMKKITAEKRKAFPADSPR